MMTVLFIFGSLSLAGTAVVTAAVALAVRRPMPAFDLAGEDRMVESYEMERDSGGSPLLLPVVSH